MSALYDLVAHYAQLGDHRTGTAADRATVDWLVSLLGEKGAEVTRHAYTFPLFTGEARGEGSAEGVPLEPLYYSATGEHSDDDAHVACIGFDESHGDGTIAQALAKIVQDTRAARARIALVATRSPTGSLCAINRAPQPPGEVAICLAPGRALEQLSRSRAGVRYSATISTGRSENVSAFFACGKSERAPLLVTTPLSGWFACAGERGTGLAIAVSVAEALSRQVPVLLVIPTGHELGYFGAARFVETFQQEISGVLHLGSCLADKTALSERGAMMSVSNLQGAAFETVCDGLRPLGIAPHQPNAPRTPEEWVGESELWAPRGDPMISIAGTSPRFHTPDDLAELVTDEETLQRVRSCVLTTAQALIA